jgi:hypothetical protein
MIVSVTVGLSAHAAGECPSTAPRINDEAIKRLIGSSSRGTHAGG